MTEATAKKGISIILPYNMYKLRQYFISNTWLFQLCVDDRLSLMMSLDHMTHDPDGYGRAVKKSVPTFIYSHKTILLREKGREQVTNSTDQGRDRKTKI